MDNIHRRIYNYITYSQTKQLQADWFGSSKTYFILTIFGKSALTDLTADAAF